MTDLTLGQRIAQKRNAFPKRNREPDKRIKALSKRTGLLLFLI